MMTVLSPAWSSDRPGHLQVNGEQLCLVAVHAHPDDESSKGAGIAAKYAAEGIRTILVTCTGGEAGDVLNAAIEPPADMGAHRRKELDRSVEILGYSKLYLL